MKLKDRKDKFIQAVTFRRVLIISSLFCGMVFLMAGVSNFVYSDPDLARMDQVELGDQRLGWLYGGLTFVMVVLAFLFLLEATWGTIFLYLVLAMALSAGVGVIKDEYWWPIFAVIAAVWSLGLAWILDEG